MSELIAKTETSMLMIEGNAYEMYAFLNAGSSLVGKVNLNFVGNKIGYYDVDDSEIALINAWKNHNSNVEKPFSMAFNLEDFTKKLNKSGAKDQVVLKFDPNKKKCQIQILKENSFGLNYDILAIDYKQKEINLESFNGLEFYNKVEVNMLQFKQIIDACCATSEEMLIEVENSTIKFSDGKEKSFQCRIPEDQLKWLKQDQKFRGRYALRFLKNIIKCGNIFGKTSTKAYKNATITLSFESEAPLKIEASAGDVQIEYFLAFNV